MHQGAGREDLQFVDQFKFAEVVVNVKGNSNTSKYEHKNTGG